MMIRQWNRSTTSHQRAFHELEDDTDNAGTGRLQEESSMSLSENASSSNNGARATATPTVFTNFLGLTIPILSRSLYRSRVTTDPATGEEQPRNSSHRGSDYDRRRMAARPVTPEQCHKASTNLSPGSNLEQQSLFTPSFSNTGLESFEQFDIDKHIQFPSNTPPKQSPRGVDLVDSVSSSPPFNPGFCSTILPCTPETRVVSIGEAADFTIEFAPSPDRPHFSPVRRDEVVVGTFLASPPAQVSPASSARSKHSNPPYIPPVQIKAPQEAPNSPAVVVPVSPDTSNNTSSDRLSSLLENPPTHHNSETSGGVVQKEAPVNQISNPPPLEFSMIHSVHYRQDDISSLGADSFGESPTGIFNSYQESNKLKSASAAAHHTMETTASPTLTTEPQTRRGLWCCAWLPNWFRRVPHVMQIAIFVGVALWFTAAALVALAVVLGKNNRQDSAALTKNNDWQETTWTLPPAAAPADTPEMTAPTVSPRSNAFDNNTAPPTQSDLPPVTVPDNQPPWGAMTAFPTFPSIPVYAFENSPPPTTRPTMKPSPFPSLAPVPETFMPTVVPTKPAMKGMRRTRVNRKPLS